MARKPPDHLSDPAKAWFSAIVTEFSMESEAEWRLLEEAAGCVQRIDEARAAIQEHGLLIETGTGSWKPNPAVVIERDCRTLLARLLRELRLNGTELTENRPPRLNRR
jgi:phage terminase small subunit